MTRIAILVTCLIAAAAVVIGMRGASARTADPERARADVKQVIDSFFDAARRQDWDRAGELFAPDFEIYTDDAAGYGKAEYIKVLKEANIQTLRMQLSDLEIRVSPDGLMAWSKYRGEFDTVVGGKASLDRTAETLILEKRAGQWKMVRAHASVKSSPH